MHLGTEYPLRPAPPASKATWARHYESCDERGIRKMHWSPAAFPPGTARVMEWFLELTASRTGTGFGMNPLSFAEIEAWARLTGTSLSRQEVILLKRLDSEYLENAAAVQELKSKDAEANNKRRDYSGRPASARPGRQ